MCRQPGVSIAAVALSRAVNANLLRRWIVQAKRASAAPRASAQPKALPRPLIEAQRFVPVALEKPATGEARIRIYCPPRGERRDRGVAVDGGSLVLRVAERSSEVFRIEAVWFALEPLDARLYDGGLHRSKFKARP